MFLIYIKSHWLLEEHLCGIKTLRSFDPRSCFLSNLFVILDLIFKEVYITHVWQGQV